MTRKTKFSLLIALGLLLNGCGNDEMAQKQIEELQTRLLSLEQEVKDLKANSAEQNLIKNNKEALDYLKPKVDQMQTDLQKLIQGLASSQVKSNTPVKTTQPITTSTDLKNAEKAIQENPQNLSLEHKKMIAMVRSYITAYPMAQIPELLNNKKAFHPDDGSAWDNQKLIRFIEVYKIPRGVKPSP